MRNFMNRKVKTPLYYFLNLIWPGISCTIILITKRSNYANFGIKTYNHVRQDSEKDKTTTVDSDVQQTLHLTFEGKAPVKKTKATKFI